MRFGIILGAVAAVSAAGCFDFPVDEWRVVRRYGVERPVVAAPATGEEGAERETVYVPQGPTNFYVEYYTPYPYYYPPGYITYYSPPPVYGGYGTAWPYGATYPTNDRGPVYGPYGYGGGALGPWGYGQGSGAAGGGTKYYPGSGQWYQPGQSRESYGIYGSGNTR